MPGVLRALAAPKELPVPRAGAKPEAEKTQLRRMLSSIALPAYHVLMVLLLPAATGAAAFGSAPQLSSIYNVWR